MSFISFILKPCDLKFGMHVVKPLILFYGTCGLNILHILFDFLAHLSWRLFWSQFVRWHCELHIFFFFSRTTGLISTKLGTKHHRLKGIKVYTNEGLVHVRLFQGQIITKELKYIDEILKSSSPEPLGQFQLNLAQSILWWSRFKFVQMKGPVLFKGEIITK